MASLNGELSNACFEDMEEQYEVPVCEESVLSNGQVGRELVKIEFVSVIEPDEVDELFESVHEEKLVEDQELCAWPAIVSKAVKFVEKFEVEHDHQKLWTVFLVALMGLPMC